MAKAEFFSNISDIIQNNNDRLSYGVSVTDFNQDGTFEFIVAGFGYSNLALSYKNGKLINIIQDPLFVDEDRNTIGVSACDIDQDGFEEIYFLNTDTYSGEKKYSDRLLDKIYTIVIDNPCNENDFPELVNRDYFCEGNELNKEYTYSVDHKLVIGVLHNAKICDVYDIDYIKNDQITGPMCEARNSMPLEELNFGMGDIFIRLAN